MIKKAVIFGVTVSASAAAADAEIQVSTDVNSLFNDLKKVEKAICSKLLDFQKMEVLDAQDLVDIKLLEDLIYRVSDSPIKYCEDRLLNKIDKNNPTEFELFNKE